MADSHQNQPLSFNEKKQPILSFLIFMKSAVVHKFCPVYLYIEYKYRIKGIFEETKKDLAKKLKN